MNTTSELVVFIWGTVFRTIKKLPQGQPRLLSEYEQENSQTLSNICDHIIGKTPFKAICFIFGKPSVKFRPLF
ncbi:hypothetical protein [Desulfospira joergensenii]|uniref:hypothetical protein n=1 Tax=Desulfospira joergensenii TaxID=53329 RepID=UPI0003B4250F|nr:hypothetical protein [Desulfospira joergensenii]